MALITTVTFADGHRETARITARAQMKAEEHAQLEKWGSIQDTAPMRYNYYLSYLAFRLAGLTSDPFDRWIDGVELATVSNTDPAADDGENPTI